MLGAVTLLAGPPGLTLACAGYVGENAAPTPVAPDDAATPAPVARLIHVGPSGDDARADGSRERPFASIRTALLVGSTEPAGCDVRVCAGNYLETELVVTTPTQLRGGYDCTTWERPGDPKSAVTTIVASDPGAGSLLSVDATGHEGAVQIERIALYGHPATAVLDPVTLRSKGARVTLDEIDVVAPVGRARTTGIDVTGGLLSNATIRARAGQAGEGAGTTAIRVGAGLRTTLERVDARAGEGTGPTGCEGIHLEAGADAVFRDTGALVANCTGTVRAGIAVALHDAQLESRGGRYLSSFVSSSTSAAQGDGIRATGASSVRSRDDHVAVATLPDGDAIVTGILLDVGSKASSFDNLQITVHAGKDHPARSTGLLVLGEAAEVRHASILMVGLGHGAAIEMAAASRIEGSLLICQSCRPGMTIGISADGSSLPAPFANVSGDVTDGFVYQVRQGASNGTSFDAQTPGQGNLNVPPCATGSTCPGTLAVTNFEPLALLVGGLPLASPPRCGISQPDHHVGLPTHDATGIERTPPFSVGAFEHDGPCAP